MAKSRQEGPGSPAPDEIVPVASNRSAFHKYEILEKLEAGMALLGTEVKSLRSGQASLAEAFARPRGRELFLLGMNIPPYEQGNRMNHEPTRARKLLLHRVQLKRIIERVSERGYTLVPLSVYFRNGYAKVQLGLARGKQQHDRREAIKEKDARRDMQRALRSRR